MTKNIFAKYDKELLLCPGKAKQDEMIAGSGWTKADGRIPGVFDSRNPGHRSITSVIWSGAEGPDRIWPVDFMKAELLIAELLDVAHREDLPQQNRGLSSLILPLVLEHFDGGPKSPEAWIAKVKKFLRIARGSYPEFTCSWMPPSELTIYVVNRTGWS